MSTTSRGRRAERLARTALALGVVLAAGVGFAGTLAGGEAGTSVAQTDAAWVTEQAGAVRASAGTVQPAVTSCEGRNAAPNLLHLAPPTDGLEVTGYLVTIKADDVPSQWQSGQASAGVPFLPANEPTYVPVATSTVAWGIGSGFNHTWTGVVTVEALGPGGWASQPVSHDWSIGFDFFGGGYGSCW